MADTTELLDGAMIDPVTGEIIDQKELAEWLLARAKEQGVSRVGPGGPLNQLTMNDLETALNAELTAHLGHQCGGTPAGANMRNGTRTKTVLTEIGPVKIEVPRDRDGSLEPVILPKRERRLDGINQIVRSLTPAGSRPGRSPRTSTRCTTQRSSRTPSAGSRRRWPARSRNGPHARCIRSTR